jgi:Fe2+ or Zn2+ uptake regulation protein
MLGAASVVAAVAPTGTEDEILNVYEYLNRARCESAATILQAALKCTRCGKIIRFLDYY